MWQDMEISRSLKDYLQERYKSLIQQDGRILFFTSKTEEYNSLKYGVGIRIHSNPVIIKLEGKDTLDFLHRVSSNEIKNLKPFCNAKTLFLNDKGRFIDRTILLNLESFFLLIGSRDSENKLQNWISRFIITEEINVEPANNQYTLLELNGAQVNSYLTLLLGNQAENINGNNIIKAEAEGIPLFLFKWPAGNVQSYFILVESGRGENFIDYLINSKSAFDLNLVGDLAYELFRIESQKPVFPNEINDSVNPHENGLIGEVSFSKGCYIGQEVIARLDTYDKVQRQIYSLTFEDGFEFSVPAPLIEDSGEAAGELTSYAFSEHAGLNLGIGFLRKKLIADGNRYFIAGTDGKKMPVNIKSEQKTD